ncbi:OmpH family outer membrane protein [Burkholderia pseudomallei]|nr:OmpH family outer membrane protein [Burkholderia pseudomallei]
MEREILKLKKSINAKHDEFLQALRDRDRAQQVADSGAGDTGAAAALQRQRAEMLGRAYLTHKTADTGQIDREIEKLEAQLREARKTAEGAAAAVEILQDKANSLLQEEGALRQQQAALARDLIQKRFDETKASYVAKVYEVIDALKALYALERGLEYFRGPNEPKPPLKLTEQLLIGLRARGLCLPPGIEPNRYPDTAWDVHFPYATDRDHHGEFAEKEIEALSQELRGYGFE